MKASVKKSLRTASITTGSLLVLAIIAGLAYTWFIGQIPAPDVPLDTSNIVQPVLKRTPVSGNVQESASVQYITSPILPGTNAMVTIKTNPISNCTISVIYDKTASTDSGLKPKVSDEYGSVSWSWTVEPTVPVGTWPVTVTCVRNKLSAVVVGSLVVSKTVQTN